MQIGTVIKRIREYKGLMQKEVPAHIGIGNSNYHKFENGHRDLSVKKLQKISILFNMIPDDILNFGKVLHTEIRVKNKSDFEKLHLINQVKEDDKTTNFKIIDVMLTKQKFQTFIEQNINTAK